MIVNLTPDSINFLNKDGATIDIYPSRGNAQITTKIEHTGTIDGIPVFKTIYSNVIGLPEPVMGTIYIVSATIKNRVIRQNRLDCFSPSQPVRNDKGTVIGYLGLD